MLFIEYHWTVPFSINTCATCTLFCIFSLQNTQYAQVLHLGLVYMYNSPKNKVKELSLTLSLIDYLVYLVNAVSTSQPCDIRY